MPFRLPFVRADALRTIAAPLLWTAYLAVPSRGAGWLDGIPLGPVEAAAIALVWWTWATARRLPATLLFVALTVAKLALGAIFLERGFAARYYENDTWTPPIVRGIEFRSNAFSRRDPRFSFGIGNAPDLPLHYFNDVRFNFYRPTEPQRDRLAYSVEWTGYLHTDASTTEATYYLATGPGVSGTLAIDGHQTMASSGASPVSRAVTLAGEWHLLTIRVTAPYGASRAIEAGEIREESRQPFDAERVFASPAGSARLVVDAMMGWITRIADTLVLASLGLLVLQRARVAWRDGRVVPLLALGAIAEALLFAGRHVGRTVLLGGGQDWLVYESMARQIALGDVIGAGQNSPFYFQAFYPYVIAVSHAAFGEGFFGIVLLQRLLLAATAGWAAAMTRQLFGARAGWIALVGGGAFLYAKGGRWTNMFLAEPFFASLLTGWTALLITMVPGPPSSARVVAAGIVGGISTLTRSTLLLAWPPMLCLWWASLAGRRGRAVVVLVITLTAVFALLPLRNWIVAGGFTVVPTSFAINLHMGNTPTRPLDPSPPERQAIYDRLGLDPLVRIVTEFAIQAPDDFARGLANKALYVVGLFGWSGLPGGIGISRLYVGMWLLALLGAVRMLRTSVASSAVVWLPAAGALSHAAALVVIFPYGYTDRLILPLYPLLIPYAAYALEPLLHFIPRAALRLRIVFGLAAGRALGWARRHVAPRIGPVLQRRRNWPYVAYIAAAAQSPELVSALLLPATALAVSRLTLSEWAHRAVGGALWAFALIRVAAAGSQSAAALNDPLFWVLLATIGLGISAATARWTALATAFAALAGGCTMVASLLPALPDFAVGLPKFDLRAAHDSWRMLSGTLGTLGALCLVAMWIQGIGWGRARQGRLERITAGARGALLAALVLFVGGAVPGADHDHRLWLMALGALLGLVEAKTR